MPRHSLVNFGILLNRMSRCSCCSHYGRSLPGSPFWRVIPGQQEIIDIFQCSPGAGWNLVTRRASVKVNGELFTLPPLAYFSCQFGRRFSWKACTPSSASLVAQIAAKRSSISLWNLVRPLFLVLRIGTSAMIHLHFFFRVLFCY